MRRTLVWVLPVLAALLYLWWNGAVRTVCAEATWPFRRTAEWVKDWFSPNEEAERENAALRVRLAEAERVERENAALRAALGWAQEHPAYIAAPVLDHGGGLGVWPRLTIGVGSAQGVEPGATVVAPEGLVGRVAADNLAPHTCQVILLSDPTNRVAAEVPGLTRGILQGDTGDDFGTRPGESLLYAPRPLLLRYIEKNTFLPTKQAVVSSGDGGLYPGGIPIGTVQHVRLDDSGLAQVAEVTPAVDPSELDLVFVRVREHADER